MVSFDSMHMWIKLEPELVPLREPAKGRHRFLGEDIEVEKLQLECQAAGVNAVDEEHFVDHTVEATGFAMNDRRVFGNGRGINTIAGQELAVTNNRSQWRAKLVADCRQESAFGLVEPLQFGGRLLFRGPGGL